VVEPGGECMLFEFMLLLVEELLLLLVGDMGSFGEGETLEPTLDTEPIDCMYGDPALLFGPEDEPSGAVEEAYMAYEPFK